MLNRRQIDIRFFKRQVDVQRQNLSAICRIAVKSLLDHACLYTHVDDDCEEFINFCSVMEQMVTHRLRPVKKALFRGSGQPREFWHILLENHACRRGSLYPTCIPSIESIETLKSPKAKLRAFIRVALMEKRLSDYIYWLLDNHRLIRDSYMEGALLASEEANVICADLIGLNVIDFNFCLKGNEHELLWPLEVSYAPFLKYSQSLASRSSDEIEMLALSGKSEELVPVSLVEGSDSDLARLQATGKDVRAIKEQKDYLEELVRLRDRQLTESNLRVENLNLTFAQRERELEADVRMVSACVLELQDEMTKLREENNRLRLEVSGLRQYKERMEMKEVPLIEMGGGPGPEPHLLQMDHVQDRMTSPLPYKRLRPSMKRQASPAPSDQRSLMSVNYDQQSTTHSLVGLSGSLSDVSTIVSEVTSQLTMKPAKMENIPSESLERKSVTEPKPDSRLQDTSDRSFYSCEDKSAESRGPKVDTDVDFSNSGSGQTDQAMLPVENVSHTLEDSPPVDDGINSEALNPDIPVLSASDTHLTEDGEIDFPVSQIPTGEQKSFGNQNVNVDSSIAEPLTPSLDVAAVLKTLDSDQSNLGSDSADADPGNSSGDGADTAWDMLSDIRTEPYQ